MNWLKNDPLVGAAVIAAVLLLGLESGLLWKIRSEAVQALTGLEQKKRERDSLQQQAPALSSENETAIVRELSGAKVKLAEARTNLDGTGEGNAAGSGKRPVDAYFELVDFGEKMRGLAAQSRVAIHADEHFGFGSHVTEGPEMEFLPAVLRQCAAVKILVGTLFECHPAALISVQREPPADRASGKNPDAARHDERNGSRVPGGRNEPKDFFTSDRAISIRAHQKLETDAFKLEFSGRTETLRDFLNKLVASPRPFVVRSVEAESIVASSSRAAVVASAPVPIVPEALTRFSVIVELIAPFAETEGAPL